MDAVDVVKPLVQQAVLLYLTWEQETWEAEQRGVDPDKSQRVQLAAARLKGACDVLAELWRQLGVESMTDSWARRTVAAQAEADRNGNARVVVL